MRHVERNKALVLEAMTALFRHRDPGAVERLCAPDYIQHNPNIPQGAEALARLVAQLPPPVSMSHSSRATASLRFTFFSTRKAPEP
ncbi:MAG: hypothetical protein KIT83_06320 [Bryobacterales bacterium]|nr:hypothetical protein [Bryobacterales bacterium]